MSRHYVPNAPVLDRTVSRPVIVVDDLTRLHGPLAGVVTVPITLNWTPRTRYDLGHRDRRTVPVSSGAAGGALRGRDRDLPQRRPAGRLWRSLNLPRAVREFWEAQHPALASS